MAYFNARELKDKMSGTGRNTRELKHDGTVKLWIPNEQFFYARRHFSLNLVPIVKSKNAKSCWCMNTSPELTEKCPICDFIQELWKDWREAKNKADKEKIQNLINALVDEKYWVNAIDINDPEHKFVAVKFTSSKMKEILTVISERNINTIIWSYKKSTSKMSNGKDKVTYALMENVDDPQALALREMEDTLIARNFADGGPVDLEKAYGKVQTYDQLMNYITKGSSDEEDSTELDEEETVGLESVATSAKTTTTQKPATLPAQKAVEKEKDISLDDISMDDTSLSLGDDDLSLDDLSDELSLDDVVKMKTLTQQFIKDNQKNKSILVPIVEYFKEKKIVEIKGVYADDVKTIFAYLKNQSVEVPESLLEESITL